MNKLKSLAPNILRIGIAIIIIWFGSQQLLYPAVWTGFLPDFVKSFPISSLTFVYLNGWFEIVCGLMLIFGAFTRIASLLLALHLLGIVFSLGYNAIAIRDLGLAIALVSIFFQGEDSWSILKE